MLGLAFVVAVELCKGRTMSTRGRGSFFITNGGPIYTIDPSF